MNKIKGQSKLTKLLTTKLATINKKAFSKLIYNSKGLGNLLDKVNNNKTIELQIVSFSSAADFNEQFFSILSFVRYVGRPSSWIIYSDGTHTAEQVELIESSFPFLKVINHRVDDSYINHTIKKLLSPYKEQFTHFAKTVAYGKKLFFYLNFDIKTPTLFIDSDIVFYQKASGLYDLLKEEFNGWFLPDAGWATLDNHYMKDRSPQHYQVNSGFFICNKNFDSITGGLEYFKSLQTKYEHFTEQNVLHIILTDNKFMPLDPRIFTLNSGDQFDFSYLSSPAKMAIRHYTGPVRHKMWQRNWKWHLSLL